MDKGSPIHNAQGFGKDVSAQCCAGGREGGLKGRDVSVPRRFLGEGSMVFAMESGLFSVGLRSPLEWWLLRHPPAAFSKCLPPRGRETGT